MKFIILLLLYTSVYYCSFGQTGPGGVGTSANNMLWLKADAGTNTTSNGTAVSNWTDQSGNSNTVSQSTNNKQPIYTTNVINGNPAILFDNNNGTNDKLVGADASSLDNTSGYTFFTISRPLTLDGGARSIVSKRTNVGVEQSFMLFYYTSNKFYVDIQTNDNRFNGTTTYSANNTYLIDVLYDGTLSSASRSKLYNGNNLDVRASETNTSVPNNNSPLIIGSTDLNDPRPFGGYISEVIGYRTALNKASRIIVNNYLSAKYNIALASEDKYAGDNSLINFDKDVAGIGSDTIMPGSVVGSNTSFSSSVAKGLGITSSSGLDVGDYLLIGHNTTNNSEMSTDVAGMTGTSNTRWQRVWYFDVTNTSTVLNGTVEFDVSNSGMAVNSMGAAADYVLLYRSSNSTGTSWTEIATANSVSGDMVLFSNVNLQNDGYYTLGYHFSSVIVLPIELSSFNAELNYNQVDVFWTTFSETNNDYFSVEKSENGKDFYEIGQIKGKGNSTQISNYLFTDEKIVEGISYYRLRQVDFNGRFTYSTIKSIENEVIELAMNVFPNPSENGNFKIHFSENDLKNEEPLTIQLVDLAGKIFHSEVLLPDKISNHHHEMNTFGSIPKGVYYLIIHRNNRKKSTKVIIQ